MAASDKPQDPKEEVAQLRAQLEALKDPVQPAAAALADKAAGVADQASEYAKQAYATVNERTEWLADRTRQSRTIALGIACVIGYVVGRIVR